MANTRLRVAAGTARGLPLVEPRGMRLRPTSGLVREAIFNILADEITGANVLDLYAGTGALGIEALSRGAERATFVDSQAASVQAILQSLARAGFAGRGEVLRGALPGALRALSGPFDVILMDPPYGDESAEPVLLALAPLLAPGGVVVYEHASRYNPPERLDRLRRADTRTYGDTAVAFYRLEEQA